MPKFLLVVCKIIGFGLLFLSWFNSGEATAFFPIIAAGILTAVRYRFPKLAPTILADGIGLFFLGEYLALSVFVISELFYRINETERERILKLRDTEASKYYELEQLQGDLLTAAAQIERMTAANERARIASEIHDNAGHDIIAAYITLQTLSEEFDAELFDTALSRLNIGVHKIREAVHNLAPLTAIGAQTLREICNRFPLCQVQFTAYGDLTNVPIYCWNLLEACLNEALTNIVRHSQAKQVKVDLDAAPNLVRLAIENDGVKIKTATTGMGLRNLRHRAAAVGGNISIDASEVFRVICVVPLK